MPVLDSHQVEVTFMPKGEVKERCGSVSGLDPGTLCVSPFSNQGLGGQDIQQRPEGICPSWYFFDDLSRNQFMQRVIDVLGPETREKGWGCGVLVDLITDGLPWRFTGVLHISCSNLAT